MPWNEVTAMSLKQEFVSLALQKNVCMADLCKRFNISRKTGYKLLQRFQAQGIEGLQEQSRRPLAFPAQTDPRIERLVLDERSAHVAWGGRKIKRSLEVQGYHPVPSASTITAILQRNGRISPQQSQARKAFIRFEHPQPNALWQMDFKGHFPLKYERCHPLTVIDDHSRYSLCLKACREETFSTVKESLTETFRCYGLPERMTMDNGAPWGNCCNSDRYSSFDIWLIRLGIRVSHSTPAHPQTQGKDERFHRTLKDEVINVVPLEYFKQTQSTFDAWRLVYNHQRPHEALGMHTPAERYVPSPRPFKEVLEPISYCDGDIVRKVAANGIISYNHRIFKIGDSFAGNYVAIRPTSTDGLFNVFFCQQLVKKIDLNTP